MKKKVLIFLFVFLFVFPICHAVNASSTQSRLVDKANLLTAAEETEILSRLNEISERQELDIVIVTVNSLNGKSPRDYADDYYDNYGYGFGLKKDGILLLVAMSTRDLYISTSGYGMKAFTDVGIEYIEDSIAPSLADEEYAFAFKEYARICDDFITRAKNGTSYGRGNYNITQFLWISLAIGLVVALIATGIMRRQLKSVRFKTGASDYMKKDSFVITKSNDIYLYKTVTRRARPKDDGGSHRSSSGRSHGGGGRKF